MDGETLRERRKALGMSQTELARLFGVRQNTVSRWEIGALAIRYPGLVLLAMERLADVAHLREAHEPRLPRKDANDDG